MTSTLPKYNDLITKLEEFSQKYPRPSMDVELGDKFDLHEHYNAIDSWYSGKVGVYILFNQDDEVVRVGSATNDLYERLNSYFDYRDDEEIVGVGWWKEGVSSRYIRVIEVPEDRAFEALAIEKYLLDELLPPLNKEGKKRHIEYRKKMLKELNRLAGVYGWARVNKSWYSYANADALE